MKNFDLIVFDWDGTVMDSTRVIVASIQQAARDLGLPVPTDEAASHVIGLGLGDALRIAVPELARADYPRMVERYVAHWRAHEDDLVLFAGMRELLETLKAGPYRLAVATGKSRAGLDRVMAHGDIGHLFDATRTADETRSKPHPQMLLELMEDLDAAPARTLMIGDTTHDAQMAANAGVPALAVSYGAHPRPQLEAAAPRSVVDSVEDLAAWLARHG
ncbi:MAG: HAD-IA family hydrolase [Burkholderiales bacterium]|nr:HAD-IA family hydrolase [Burkholderiales bacterium]